MALSLALLLGQLPAAAAEEVPPSWLPLAAAGSSFILPGLGQGILGQWGQGAVYFGTGIGPTLLKVPPYANVDRPGHETSIIAYVGQTSHFLSVHQAYQEARLRLGNSGYPQPLREQSPWELIVAPFLPENLLDWRLWSFAVGEIALQSLVFGGPWRNRSILDARSANVAGAEVSPLVGYGVHLTGAAVLASAAGISEEILFRGVIQNELERPLGATGAVIATSGIFGLAHMNGVNVGSNAVVVLGTGLLSMPYGFLYQASAYDLRKPIAAHAYYDLLAFAINGLFPAANGVTKFGVRYAF